MTKTDPAPRTADDVLGAIHPAQDEVKLCLDGRLNLEQTHLLRRLNEAVAHDQTTNEDDTAPAVAAEIEEIQQRISDAEQVFLIEAVGHRRYADLEAEHPPNEQQQRYRMPHNPETFLPVLLAESIIDPAGWTPEKVTLLAERLGEGQWDRLTNAVMSLNKGAGSAPLPPNALKLLRGFDASSTT